MGGRRRLKRESALASPPDVAKGETAALRQPSSSRKPHAAIRIVKNTTQAVETAPDNAFGVSGATKTASSPAKARDDAIEPGNVALRHPHIIARARLLKFLQRRRIMIPCRLQRRAALRFVRLRFPLAEAP